MSDTSFEARDVKVTIDPNPHRYEYDVTITATLDQRQTENLFNALFQLGIPADVGAEVPILDGTIILNLKKRNEAQR